MKVRSNPAAPGQSRKRGRARAAGWVAGSQVRSPPQQVIVLVGFALPRFL